MGLAQEDVVAEEKAVDDKDGSRTVSEASDERLGGGGAVVWCLWCVCVCMRARNMLIGKRGGASVRRKPAGMGGTPPSWQANEMTGVAKIVVQNGFNRNFLSGWSSAALCN
jgi:hypothetical protein